MTLINKQDRSVLGEGRDFGLGFAFVKKEDDTFVTVQPISPCKDYLNDVVYSEHTGNKCSAYGLTYDKQGIFDNVCYMVTRECHYISGNLYTKFDDEEKQMESNLHNLVCLLNMVEAQLQIEGRSSAIRLEDSHYVFVMPFEWCSSTYMISLYSLLIRIGRWYNGTDEIFTFLDNFKQLPQDVYLVKAALPNIKKLLETRKYKQALETSKGNITIHNKGICAYINATDLID